MNPEVVKQLLLLFVLMAIGFIGTKIKLIDKVGSDKISALISRVTMPAMYLSTFMAQPFSTSSLKRIGTLFAISAGYYALATAIGFLYVKVTRADEKSRGVYQFMMIFSNAAYMGFPVLRAVLGEEAIFFAAFYNLPFNILAYSLGIWLLHRGRTDMAVNKKEMFLNPGTLSVVAGALMFLVSPLIMDTKVYDWIYRGVLWSGLDCLGDTTVPQNWRVWGVCAVRLLVLPLIVLGVLKLLPIDSLTLGIPVLVTAMPCAVFCVILAKEYGGDEKTGSIGVFLSTLLSAATIPLISALL